MTVFAFAAPLFSVSSVGFAASEGMPLSSICLIVSPATACASASVRLTEIVAVEDGGTISGTSVSSAFHAPSALES